MSAGQTMGIVVYSKPNCPQCVATKRRLDKRGAAYTVVDVTEDAGALAFVRRDLGYQQVPVVVLESGAHWSGFQPDLIEAALAEGAAA